MSLFAQWTIYLLRQGCATTQADLEFEIFLPLTGITGGISVFWAVNDVFNLLPRGFSLLDLCLELALAWKLRGSDWSLKNF